MNIIFYDLETNGLDYETTSIMQICIIDDKKNVLINEYAHPFDGRIEASEIHGITMDTLINNNAKTNVDLCTYIKSTLRERYLREKVYWVAYNNFGFDQIILENNFRKAGVKISADWVFIDLYPYIREIYPDIKPNFKLATIHQIITQKDNTNISFHNALDDVLCLYDIFECLGITRNLLFTKYCRHLLQDDRIFESPISAVNGYYNSLKLDEKNIKKIGDLYLIYQTYSFDKSLFENHLKTNLGIYSNFIVKNFVKQMDVIRTYH